MKDFGMMPPLQLTHYLLEELELKAVGGFDESASSNGIYRPAQEHLRITDKCYKSHENPSQHKLELKIALKQNVKTHSPWFFKLVITGFFQVIEELQDEKKSSLIRTNGLSILYSTARQILYDVSGNGFYCRLFLPTVSFYPPPRKNITSKKAISRK